jgi:hypothetical protein
MSFSEKVSFFRREGLVLKAIDERAFSQTSVWVFLCLQGSSAMG